MPRAKKLPGHAVDSRNGQQLALPAASLPRFSLPKRSDGKSYDLRTRRMWKSLWDDERLSSVLSPVDRELVIRWAQSVDDAIKAAALAWESPISKGSMKQDIKSPYFDIRDSALAVAERCEAQIGIGALNRARLGIAILAEAKGLADLAAAFPGDEGGDDEPDPRLP